MENQNTTVIDVTIKTMNDKIDQHEDRINKLEDISVEYQQKMAVLYERLTENLENIRETNRDIKDTLKEQSKMNEEIKVFMATTNYQLTEDRNDINTVLDANIQLNEKGKIDIIKWLSTNWFPILTALTAAGILGKDLIQ